MSAPDSEKVAQSSAARQETFRSLDPRTSEVVGVYPVHTAAEVTAAVHRARGAATWWGDLGFAERKRLLSRWTGIITRRVPQLVDLIRAETGKSLGDARLEVVVAIDHLAWAAKHARAVLGPQRRSPGLILANFAATVEYEPFGVVGVIGPWNYPVFTPMGAIGYALAAGNAVVFKPSEYTPGVGKWLAETFAEAVGEQPVFQVITGFGPTGAALCRAGVDKMAFTGSAKTGRQVMAACAESLTPVVIEGGGKDALLVDADADVDAAADAAVWGALANAGQTCVGVERVYVHEQVYDQFIKKLLDKARTIRAGTDEAATIGPITVPAQLNIIKEHIADALARGGKALLGGVDTVGDRLVQPTVLTNVPENSIVVTDETFGPTMTVAKVRDMDEAVARANGTKYGLGNTVFSRSRGMELARKLRCGMVTVNSVISFVGIPSLPFGGVGDSGFGRVHGLDGLREFARAKAIARPLFRVPINLTTFSRSSKADQFVVKIMTILHGKK